MRILFFDDDDNRHAQFRLRFNELSGHEVVHVRTVDEAIEALKGERFGLVCLDHDLDLIDPSGEQTGKDVARYIALHMERDTLPGRVIIHSCNPDGAKEMEAILRAGGVSVVRQEFRA